MFISHNATFINDINPFRVKKSVRKIYTDKDRICIPTLIKKGISSGSSAMMLCDISVGEDAIARAGSLVMKDVPPNTIIAGNPTRIIREFEEK